MTNKKSYKSLIVFSALLTWLTIDTFILAKDDVDAVRDGISEEVMVQKWEQEQIMMREEGIRYQEEYADKDIK